MTRAIAAAMLVLLVDASAWACEPMPCQSGWMLPSGGSMPANAPGMLWSPRRGYGPPMAAEDFAERVELLVAERATPSQVRSYGITGAFFVTPRTGGFRPGATYRLRAPQQCRPDGPEALVADVEIGPRADHPSELGTLGVREAERGRLQVQSSGGGCSAVDLAAFVDVEVRYHESARPWTDVLWYETFVDGEPYRASESLNRDPLPGSSWVGRGRDRIYALCDAAALGEGGVDEGTHRVKVVATLPDTDVRIETDEVQIELDCGRDRTPAPEPQPAPEPETTAEDEGLCAASGRRSAWWASSWWALATVLLWRRRRRA